MDNKLIDFVERLPMGEVTKADGTTETLCLAAVFTARIGHKQDLTIAWRGAMTWAMDLGMSPSDKIVPTMQYETLDDLVEECLQVCEDDGWGSEHDTLRFQTYLLDGTPLRSKVLKKDIVDDSLLQHGAIQSLTMANIRMSEEIRRTMREVANNNKEHLHTIARLTDSLVASRKEQLSLERENMARELIMENHDMESGDDTRQQGISLLERVVSGLFSQQSQNIDDIIKETIKTDPSKVREYMEDPEVVEAIMKEAMRDKGGETDA